MNTRRRLLLAAGVTLAVWAVFTWPLPRYACSGVPSSARNVEKNQVRRMIAGDHLQLLYHFWLARDMLSGNTPPFHNLYEFNTGKDAATYKPDPYYVPFSLVFALASWAGGRAFGWNATGWLALFATYLCTWLLARRYSSSDRTAGVAALLGIVLPYRWAVLLGGSPTGFAMALVPMLLLGLDLAVRDERVGGGVLAGLALLFAFCSDLQTFFFAALSVPGWCVLSFVARQGFAWKDPRAYSRLALALAPAAVLFLAAAVLSRATAADLAASRMSEGWPLREVARYSPRPAGFLAWRDMGLSNGLYLGAVTAVLIAAGGIALAAGCVKTPRLHGRRLAVFALLFLAVAGIAALALGTNGPGHGILLVGVRRLVPPYRMVRQTTKILCLMPSFLAVAAALGGDALAVRLRNKAGLRATAAALVLLALAEYRVQIRPTVCLLDTQQGAYAAASGNDRAAGRPARAIILPLWPGNSHWASLYEHYASLYRIRTINGYRPAVPRGYVDEVFRRFESLNQGEISDAQLDDLLTRGIRHVLLHEDAFPEQVSPFPAGVTLKRLLHHPRLALVKQDQRVWALRILSQPRTGEPVARSWTYLFPARRWEAERVAGESAVRVAEPEAGGGACVRLCRTDAGLTFATRAPVARAPGLRWMFRVRGAATLRAAEPHEQQPGGARTVRLDAADWTWLDLPVLSRSDFFVAALQLGVEAGTADVDLCLLAAGPWESPGAGETLVLPAPCFFHAGYTDLAADAVVFRAERDPDRRILYGPGLPLEPGRYTVRLLFTTGAAPGTHLGDLEIEPAGVRVPVVSGSPCERTFAQAHNLPFTAGFVFTRNADLAVRAVTLTRTARPQAAQADP